MTRGGADPSDLGVARKDDDDDDDDDDDEDDEDDDDGKWMGREAGRGGVGIGAGGSRGIDPSSESMSRSTHALSADASYSGYSLISPVSEPMLSYMADVDVEDSRCS